MSDFDVPKTVFEKGSYVFGVCTDSLPWPAKITKINKENFTVKFIKDNSTAVLKEDCLITFNDQTIIQVMNDYKKCEKASNKVFVAIKACKNEIEGLKKK
jgi:hypothetical protein